MQSESHGRQGSRFKKGAVPLAVAWLEFWSLLFPTECVVCSTPDTSLCKPCRKLLRKGTVRPFRAEESAESLPEIAPDRPLPVLAAGVYRRELSSTLLAYKNRGHTDLRPVLGTVLGGALHLAVDELSSSGNREVLLVPIPSTGGARRRRGYEPVYSLLRRLDRQAMLPASAVCARALTVPPFWWRLLGTAARGTRAGEGLSWQQDVSRALAHRFGSQKGLGAAARRSNVRNTMRLRHRWKRGPGPQPGQFDCLIVDDVLTTGATLSEAERALREGGATVLGAVVVAATQPPKGPGQAELPVEPARTDQEVEIGQQISVDG
ncbi:ComF family protein [Arthrobacter monumenti]